MTEYIQHYRVVTVGLFITSNSEVTSGFARGKKVPYEKWYAENVLVV